MPGLEDMDELRASLKQKMEEAARTYQQYERAYKALTPDQPSSGKYFRLRVWQAIREYLKQVGGKASINEIEDELVREQVEMGRYPRRTVKNAVCSPYTLNRIFKIDHVGNDEVVVLIESLKEGGKKASSSSAKSKSGR